VVGEGVSLELGMVLDFDGGALLATSGGADGESILDSGLHVYLGLKEAVSVDCLLLELLKSNDLLFEHFVLLLEMVDFSFLLFAAGFVSGVLAQQLL